MGRLFDFAHVWTVTADVRDVVDVLADPLHYPSWWPQVRSARPAPAAQESVALTVRSALPYTLRLVLTRELEDRSGGLLVVRIDGDLLGWASMLVRPAGEGTRMDYRQRVAIAAPSVARWSRPAAPVLRMNHAWMMRGGERGLRRRLAPARSVDGAHGDGRGPSGRGSGKPHGRSRDTDPL